MFPIRRLYMGRLEWPAEPTVCVRRGVGVARLLARRLNASLGKMLRHDLYCALVAYAARTVGAASTAEGLQYFLPHYAQMHRVTNSLRLLRHEIGFERLLRDLIATDDEDQYNHDEFVAFTATKILAQMLPVLPLRAGSKLGKTPDLVVPNATSVGGRLLLECKERSTAADRAPDKIAKWFGDKLEEGIAQVRAALGPNDLGAVAVDVGPMPGPPPSAMLESIAKKVDAQAALYPWLALASFSYTLLPCDEVEEPDGFRMIVTPESHALGLYLATAVSGRELLPAVREALECGIPAHRHIKLPGSGSAPENPPPVVSRRWAWLP